MADSKKLFNARDGLGDFDALSPSGDRQTTSNILETTYSKEEWDEYHIAKEICEKRGEIWKKVRSDKHHIMAKLYSENHKQLKKMDDEYKQSKNKK